jgi:hypothetical protein
MRIASRNGARPVKTGRQGGGAAGLDVSSPGLDERAPIAGRLIASGREGRAVTACSLSADASLNYFF